MPQDRVGRAFRNGYERLSAREAAAVAAAVGAIKATRDAAGDAVRSSAAGGRKGDQDASACILIQKPPVQLLGKPAMAVKPMMAVTTRPVLAPVLAMAMAAKPMPAGQANDADSGDGG